MVAQLGALGSLKKDTAASSGLDKIMAKIPPISLTGGAAAPSGVDQAVRNEFGSTNVYASSGSGIWLFLFGLIAGATWLLIRKN